MKVKILVNKVTQNIKYVMSKKRNTLNNMFN